MLDDTICKAVDFFDGIIVEFVIADAAEYRERFVDIVFKGGDIGDFSVLDEVVGALHEEGVLDITGVVTGAIFGRDNDILDVWARRFAVVFHIYSFSPFVSVDGSIGSAIVIRGFISRSVNS